MLKVVRGGKSGVVYISYHAHGACYELCPPKWFTISMFGVIWPTRDVVTGKNPNYHLSLSLCPPPGTRLGTVESSCVPHDIGLAPVSPPSCSQT
jgi:hypothetical protein